ncbi:DUF803-domain-containing protein [Cystobasidium minutum MCA 4210]|uniref:DUF803-domain-containing protein n=1 Tax=Cystobasidium minutum MCA 4210 TaxID=1397322 RepID=UPI0034CEEF0E|eukprot:jgi/Rhomi1/161793/estExt_Genewise1Plus.C_5_t10272
MVPLDSSYVGIAVSILGNVLISVSLNTQKLAHKRQSEAHTKPRSGSLDSSHRRKTGQRHSERTPLLSQAKGRNSRSSKNRNDLAVYAVEPSAENGNAIPETVSENPQIDGNLSQTVTKLPNPEAIVRNLAENNAEIAVQEGPNGRIRRKWLEVTGGQKYHNDPHSTSRGDDGASARHIYGIASKRKQRARETADGADKHAAKSEENVYASKLWWLGLCLMALGELGNFTSYAFAPASVVAPLGTVALIANCFIAPLMLHERFRKKDIVGIGFSIIGAVTIVLSAKSENKSLTPHQFIRAVSQPAFIVYASVSVGLTLILIGLSRTRAGDKYLAIDILICALCGGLTVLSVKAFSSFLTQNFVECFKQWPTYPVLAVLAITAVMQIIYLNKALSRFESRVVVPTQFVSFTISAITGSAILYRDFEDVQLGKVIAFFTGCALVFVGVVFLTSSRFSNQDQDEHGDTSYSTTGNEASEPNDSQVTVSSIGSQGRLLDGVALTSHPPADGGQELSRSPAAAGRVLRKYNSIGNLPSRTTSPRSGAVATPIRTARNPNIATSKLFSPGYILIAGSGFGNLSDHGSEDGHPEEDEENLDLEAGSRRFNNASGSSSQTLRPELSDELRNSATGNEDSLEIEDGGDYEPMTRSAQMRRSGTV